MREVVGGDRRRAEPVGELAARVAEPCERDHAARPCRATPTKTRNATPAREPLRLAVSRSAATRSLTASLHQERGDVVEQRAAVELLGALDERGDAARRDVRRRSAAHHRREPFRRRGARRRRRCGPRSGRRCRAAATTARAARARRPSSAASSTTPSGGSPCSRLQRRRCRRRRSAAAADGRRGGASTPARSGAIVDHAERREHPRVVALVRRGRPAASAAALRSRGRRAPACARRSAGETPSAAASGPWPETSPITACTVPSAVWTAS